MSVEIRLWQIQPNNQLDEIESTGLDLEERLEDWLEKDVTILSDDILLIGRQITTDFGGIIDLMGLNGNGDVVLIELKREKTSREITAQILDYATWVKDLSNEQCTQIADKYLGKHGFDSLEEAFRKKFGIEVPEILNENHSMLVVASHIDSASERIIKYLSDNYGVNINAVTFQYFKKSNGEEYLARTFLIEPSQVEYLTKVRSTSKRKPNLSLHELEEIANERGVGDSYSKIIVALEQHLQKTTTRSSLSFYGNIEGSQKAIFSLIPTDSNQDDGLHFHVYLSRFMNYFDADQTSVMNLLPSNREDWKYYQGADDDYSGYAGYFQTVEEIQHFVSSIGSMAPNTA